MQCRSLICFLLTLVTLLYAGCARELEYTASNTLQSNHLFKTAILPFTHDKKNAQPESAGLIRQLFTANIQQANLDLMEIALVDSLLRAQNLTDPDDIARIAKNNPRRLGEILGAEVIITGHVVQWKKSYALIHSDIEVEATISMIDTASGETLMTVSKGEIRNAGISRIPTGYVSAAVAPIKGLQSIFLYKLSQDLARNLSEPVLVTFKGKGVKPIILSAAALTKNSGTKQELYVVLFGDSGNKAQFDAGSLRNVPLSELTDGFYCGSIQGDFSGVERISVSLSDFSQQAHELVTVNKSQ